MNADKKLNSAKHSTLMSLFLVMTVSQTTVLANSDHEKANRQTTFTHISNRQHDADAATLFTIVSRYSEVHVWLLESKDCGLARMDKYSFK